jgi:hypothetical protein
MAHFAKLDENNIVISVHVVNNDVILVDNIESEQAGIDFLRELHDHDKWKQTSYNRSFRKNFAAPGYIYLEEHDIFIAPKPYTSWLLNLESGTWQPPIAKPENMINLEWSENTQSWEDMSRGN